MESSHLNAIIIVFLLSLFGAHARYVFDYGKLNIRKLMGEYVIGSFAGLSMFYLVHSYDKINVDIKCFCVVMAGFCARDVIKLFSYIFVEKIQKFFGKKQDTEVTPPKEEDSSSDSDPTKKE